MKYLLLFLLFPVLVFGQDKNQKIESVFKNFTIDTENNLFSYKQDLNVLNFEVSDKDLQLNKELYHIKTDYNPYKFRPEQIPLHRNPLNYHDYEYQRLGSQGMFYTNLVGGLIETIFDGPIKFKL